MLEEYLQGTKFIIRTDHKALRWILSVTDSKGKLARSRLRLSVFDYEMVHRVFIKRQEPDALSSLDTSGEYKKTIEDDFPLIIVEMDGRTPTTVCYLCEGLTTGMEISEILSIDITDPPPSIIEIV